MRTGNDILLDGLFGDGSHTGLGLRQSHNQYGCRPKIGSMVIGTINRRNAGVHGMRNYTILVESYGNQRYHIASNSKLDDSSLLPMFLWGVTSEKNAFHAYIN